MFKRRSWGQQKPPLGSTINWGHPLSNRLCFYSLLNENGGLKSNALSTAYPKVTGALTGGAKFEKDGVFFDASNDYIIYNPSTSIAFRGQGWSTWAAKVYCKGAGGTGGQGDIFSKGGDHSQYGATNGRTMQTIGGGDQIIFRIQAGGGNVWNMYTADGAMSLNNWHTIVVLQSGRATDTYSISTGKIYLDGVEQVVTIANGYYDDNAEFLPNYWYIGGTGGSYPRVFNGYIAWVGVWKRALSPSEIQSLYVSPYQFISRPSRRLYFISGVGTSLSGTVTTATEADIVTGGKTIILTLTGDTWVVAGATFDGQRQNIINGIDSAQSEATGWDAVVKATQGVAGVVRTSDTVVTITLDAQATYNITATETITATIPASALTGASPIVASPTFNVTADAAVGAGMMSTRTGYWGDI